MITIETCQDVRNFSNTCRREGKSIAFVPTMGYLHAGHLSLIEEARKRADVVIVSIFVNPTQFGEGEDFDIYPRDIERDRDLLRDAGADLLFLPSVSEIYPKGFQTFVEVEGISKGLCGESRPGHFRGVATVVSKLFNIVMPHVALFGQKDYQQLAVIKRMTRDMNFGIEIVGVPTVREEDGLAMSSRNIRLLSDERKEALSLYKALSKGRDIFKNGVIDTAAIISESAKQIPESVSIDYMEIRDAETLETVDRITKTSIFAVAAKVGNTRLIDNIILKEEIN